MSAIFSPGPDPLWRYRLDRTLPGAGPIVGFCLHNPSTAGHDTEDPTSTRGIGFATLWGARHLIYMNPWAAIATKPAQLWEMDDPVGPDNDIHIDAVAAEVAASGGFIVMAYGAITPPKRHRAAALARLAYVEAIIRHTGCEIRCLGENAGGSPKHPLYLRSDTMPVLWPIKKEAATAQLHGARKDLLC